MIKIYAFWSLVKFVAIELIFLVLCGISIKDNFSHLKLIDIILIGVVITLPLLISLCDHVEIRLDTIEFYYLTLRKPNRQNNSGFWRIYKNELLSVNVIKLSRKEKRALSSQGFIFNKYLRVVLLSGECKYVYISTFNNSQIKEIINQFANK